MRVGAPYVSTRPLRCGGCRNCSLWRDTSRRSAGVPASASADRRPDFGGSRPEKSLDWCAGPGCVALFDVIWPIRDSIQPPQGVRARFAVYRALCLELRANGGVAGYLVDEWL